MKVEKPAPEHPEQAVGVSHAVAARASIGADEEEEDKGAASSGGVAAEEAAQGQNEACHADEEDSRLVAPKAIWPEESEQ